MKLFLYSLFFTSLLIFSSCTSIKYTYGSAETKVKAFKVNNQAKYENYSYKFKHNVQTLTILDTSGTLMAGLSTYNNRQEAIDKAIKEHKNEAKWRVHSASEFQDGSTSMGFFFRWFGEDTNSTNSFIEGGIIIDASMYITDTFLFKPIVRMSMYTWKLYKVYEENKVGKVTGGEISVGGSLNYNPDFLFGIGFFTEASYNLLDMIPFSFMVNYNAGVLYKYSFSKNTALKLGVKYESRIRHNFDNEEDLYPEIATKEFGAFISFGHFW
jgi:hypothetical protein